MKNIAQSEVLKLKDQVAYQVAHKFIQYNFY